MALPDSLSYFDLLLRAATAGPLLLAAMLLVWRYKTAEHYSLAAICLCLVCYLALTAPAANAFATLRLVALAGTDFTGIALWFYAIHAFDNRLHSKYWPRWAGVTVGGFLLWHASYFLVLGGQGLYHHISHGLAVILCIHVLVMAIRGFGDELSTGYRLARVCITLVAAVLMLLLAVNEFTRSVPVREPRVSLIMASVLFVAVSGICLAALADLLGPTGKVGQSGTIGKQPAGQGPVGDKLQAFLANGGYTDSGLTIAGLARELKVPEHQLRRLINRQLGYRNFSQFLNHYRIARAREQLVDPALTTTPILTIALELGYGSIGPFNRAFRQQTGITPSEYRKTAL